jgi:beta-N-acetylhexosaminidase
MAHGLGGEPGREEARSGDDSQEQSRPARTRQRGRSITKTHSRRGHRAWRVYPATLLLAFSCLLGLFACDLLPNTESSNQAKLEHSTTGTKQKPLTFAQQIALTVNYTMARMTLDQKIGQMMMFETTAQSWNNDMDAMVRQMNAGAIIIYKKNMINPNQLTSFIAATQAHSDIPMFVTMDEEGGNVDRLGDLGFAPPLPSAVYLGSTGDPQRAHQAGVSAALELQRYGINVDLAPVVDVRLVPDQIEGPRLFGNDPYTVESYASQFLNGLQQNMIIGTLKHWPGIGDAQSDPHKTLPVIDRTRDQLEATEFAPFRMLLKDNPGMIMVTHVIVSSIDKTMPSSLSPALVQGVLRSELGYQGVIITDNLWMRGVSDQYSLGQASVLAIQAGDDLLEGAWDPTELRNMINAVKNAVSSGAISRDRIDQSVRRLLTLKAQYGILPLHTTHPPRPVPDTASAADSPLVNADLPRNYAASA